MSYEQSAAVAENRQQTFVPQKQIKNKQPQPKSKTKAPDIVGDILQKIRNFRVEFGPNRKDVLNFTNQLAVMVKAGINIKDALEGIAAQEEKQKFRLIITDLKNQIEAGQSFSQTLAEHPQVFSNLYVNMVAAAEASGSLSSMLRKLTEYLDREHETRSQIKGAMVYPIIIAVMAVAVVIFLLCFVLPRFTAIFAGKEDLLPLPTKILMASSAFMRGYWFVIIPALAAAVWAFIYFVGTTVGRTWWDRTKLALPLVKTLCRNLYISRSLHTMGVLVQAGVPILNTIAITAQIAGNVLYRDMWLGVLSEIRQGKKIASSLNRFTLLPNNVVQMISSGEESGSMAEVLRDISDYYSRELKAAIKTVTSMIEPIMIVLMGFLVGFIAMSVILPIFKMSHVVSK
jgi:type IV pilus assembly protein PilC